MFSPDAERDGRHLTLISILMFLRFGFILGQSGFLGMMGESLVCWLWSYTHYL
jgi:hypothetical protein